MEQVTATQLLPGLVGLGTFWIEDGSRRGHVGKDAIEAGQRQVDHADVATRAPRLGDRAIAQVTVDGPFG